VIANAILSREAIDRPYCAGSVMKEQLHDGLGRFVWDPKGGIYDEVAPYPPREK
jgi:hypothetical protein